MLFAEIDPQLKASQKKQSKLKQKFPAAPNSLKRKKIKASAIIAEQINTELLKPVVLGENTGSAFLSVCLFHIDTCLNSF